MNDQVLRWAMDTCNECGSDWPCQAAEEGTPAQAEGHRPLLTADDLHWVICRRCRGDGSLRGWPGAYTESDRAEWSDEDYEDYKTFRRACDDCDGTGKVREITEAALERPEVREYLDDWRDTEAIYAAERGMGA